MDPILIFRHVGCEGPGYLDEYLTGRGVPFRLICIDRGDTVPESPDGTSALVFMGGTMSVNDPLPWVQQELVLIRQAAERGLPMLGHCLGGQLLARALGGVVSPNPVREIGWWPVEVVPGVATDPWLAGLPGRFEVFHWHGETFSLPPGATHLLRSEHCAHQAFAIGNTLGLQFHVEMTGPMVEEWAALYERDLEVVSPVVQSRTALRERLAERVKHLRVVADNLYGPWLNSVVR
jgi:GMP synthase-like glutamine amidotransferase